MIKLVIQLEFYNLLRLKFIQEKFQYNKTVVFFYDLITFNH